MPAIRKIQKKENRIGIDVANEREDESEIVNKNVRIYMRQTEFLLNWKIGCMIEFLSECVSHTIVKTCDCQHSN